MLVVYTSPGCASCRKAKQFFKDKGIQFKEKNIFTSLLKDSEIRFLLSRSDNGSDDLVSKRSKVIKDNAIDLDNMSTSELIGFIQQNPSVLKRPIILDEDNLLVGYDSEEIEVFDRQTNYYQLRCSKQNCPNYGICGKLREEEEQ